MLERFGARVFDAHLRFCGIHPRRHELSSVEVGTAVLGALVLTALAAMTLRPMGLQRHALLVAPLLSLLTAWLAKRELDASLKGVSAWMARPGVQGANGPQRVPLDAPQKGDLEERQAYFGDVAVAHQQLAECLRLAHRGDWSGAWERSEDIAEHLLTEKAYRVLVALELCARGVKADSEDGFDAEERRRWLRDAHDVCPCSVNLLDAMLGRALVADAWEHQGRLRSLDKRWQLAGVGLWSTGALSRMRTLIGVRLDERMVSDLDGQDARIFAQEAMGVGDQDLAQRLENYAKSRTAAPLAA